MDYTVHRILQARILEWVAIPFSRRSSQPRNWTQVSHVMVDSLPAEPPGKPKNTGVGSPSLLQWILPTQELNQGFLHCRQILYQLSHLGSPRILEWVAHPFSSRFSQPKNWTRVSCIAGKFTSWATREGLGFFISMVILALVTNSIRQQSYPWAVSLALKTLYWPWFSPLFASTIYIYILILISHLWLSPFAVHLKLPQQC